MFNSTMEAKDERYYYQIMMHAYENIIGGNFELVVQIRELTRRSKKDKNHSLEGKKEEEGNLNGEDMLDIFFEACNNSKNNAWHFVASG